MKSMYLKVENEAAHISHHHHITCLTTDNSSNSNKYAISMVSNNNIGGCPGDRVIWVYIASFLPLLRKLSNKTLAQINQCHELILNFALKAANLVPLVMKKPYEKINLVVLCAYKECVLTKSLGFNIFVERKHAVLWKHVPSWLRLL